MACSLTLTGQVVVGGDGCGCSGSGSGSGGSGQKLQPLSLGCSSSSYGAIGSTDCAVRINSPSEFRPLPGVDSVGLVSLLYVQSDSAVALRWGGSVAKIEGVPILGGATFVGTETFEFTVGSSTAINVLFSAGSFTLAQVADTLNGAAVQAGLGYLPFRLNDAGTALVLSQSKKGESELVGINQPQPLIGFLSIESAGGTNPTEVSVEGTFLSQFNPGISGLEVKGISDISVLAAGEAA